MKYTWSEIYDSIWYGEEFALFYQGKRYFLQAWEKDGNHYREIDDYDTYEDYFLLNREFPSREEAAQAVLEAKVFDGKTIKEIYENAEIADWD